MKHLVEVRLQTTKSNISISNGKVGHWFFQWQNNLVTAYAFAEYTQSMISEPFEMLESTNKLNLGLLIDILTLCVNQEINTSIAISTDLNAKIYKLPAIKKANSVSEMIALQRTGSQVCNASALGAEFPKRIEDNVTITLDGAQLAIMNHLLDFMQDKKRFTPIEMKLLNYWRRGVDLDLLYYFDESFLAFFKIIEYFAKKSQLKVDQIPEDFKKTRSLTMAYRIADGAGLKKLNEDQFKLLASFVHIRNNWDIAHTKMSQLPNVRESGLYYSHVHEVWDLHSHICQISRFIILKQLGLRDIQLEINGGLFELVLDTKSE